MLIGFRAQAKISSCTFVVEISPYIAHKILENISPHRGIMV